MNIVFPSITDAKWRGGIVSLNISGHLCLVISVALVYDEVVQLLMDVTGRQMEFATGSAFCSATIASIDIRMGRFETGKYYLKSSPFLPSLLMASIRYAEKEPGRIWINLNIPSKDFSIM